MKIIIIEDCLHICAKPKTSFAKPEPFAKPNIAAGLLSAIREGCPALMRQHDGQRACKSRASIAVGENTLQVPRLDQRGMKSNEKPKLKASLRVAGPRH